ncbi:MAG: S41 family peptidase [Candidatus Methylacidiphilales bacterium]|nr:S41 family peptidase [Candidatus Methylacidiphilales bacterium]
MKAGRAAPLFLALAVSASALVAPVRGQTLPTTVPPAPAGANDEARYRSAVVFSSVLELIREEYVDAGSVDYEKLTYAALDGMLASLDPYSEFLDPEGYSAMRSETEGEFGGLGIYVGMLPNRTLVVNMPVEGGPAAKAGLLPGDWVVKINGTSTKGMSVRDSVQAMRGKPGESVQLLIFRPSTNETLEVAVERELINVPTVRGVRILQEYTRGNSRVGYIRLVQFGEKTVAEFDAALQQLQNEGANGLVLDLRNNPGGLLDVSAQIAGRFVPAGTVIVSTEGRKGVSERNFFQAKGRTHFPDLPLVVLVNRHSASAAEIVSGALKDLGRAVLVGDVTYGKGSVQTVQPVDPNAKPLVGVRLTTAKYYTPSHAPIHGVGITPHILVPISLKEEQNVLRRQNWHLLSPEQQTEVQNLPDTQLGRAVNALQAIQLYGERKQSKQIAWVR